MIIKLELLDVCQVEGRLSFNLTVQSFIEAKIKHKCVDAIKSCEANRS